MVVRTPQHIAVPHQVCNPGCRPIQTRKQGPKLQSGEYTKPYVGESPTVHQSGGCKVCFNRVKYFVFRDLLFFCAVAYLIFPSVKFNATQEHITGSILGLARTHWRGCK